MYVFGPADDFDFFAPLALFAISSLFLPHHHYYFLSWYLAMVIFEALFPEMIKEKFD